MVIDCFTFFNELDLLECRLEYLNEKVDYFVLVESNITFTGKQKPFYFLENQIRFSKFKHKIIYYPFIFDNSIYKFDFDNLPNGKNPDYNSAPWQVEYMQRNHIAEALKLFNGNPYVILSDVDEIPRLESIDYCKNNLNEFRKFQSLVINFFFYNLNNLDPLQWPSIIFSRKQDVIEKTPQWLRWQRSNPSINLEQNNFFVPNSGWHLTYFSDINGIKNKIKSFAHHELNRPEIVDEEHIAKCIKEGINVFHTEENPTVRYLNPSIDFFPENFFKIFGKYYNQT